jgi:hypothetical protein
MAAPMSMACSSRLSADAMDLCDDGGAEMEEACCDAAVPSFAAPAAPSFSASASAAAPAPVRGDRLQQLLQMQAIDGSFSLTAALLALVGAPAALSSSLTTDQRALATALALAFLEQVLGDREPEWRMVARKARSVLNGLLGGAADALVDSLRGQVH